MSDTAAPKAPAAATVGGMRRRAAPKGATKAKAGVAAPAASSGVGGLSFLSDEGGLRVGPVTVLVMSLSFMVIVVALHILAKLKAAVVA